MKRIAKREEISDAKTIKFPALVLSCFFISGLTGLIYEILWTRMIVKVIGTAPFAVTIILVVFMGGLGLGSFLAGRYIDRMGDPEKIIRTYGILELAIGAYGLLIPLLLLAFKPVYSLLYNQLYNYTILYSIITFAGCSAILFFPVVCMGATLPLLSRFYVTRLSHLGSHVGRLYGLNTIGAALGAVLGGFFLIDLLGINGTLIFAVFCNCAIGISCFAVSDRIKGAVQEMTAAGHQNISEMATVCRSKEVITAALIIFMVSGFSSMAYEVIWTRLLGLIIGPTTYSFTIVLAVFITGIALGNIVFGRLADRTKNVIWLLIFTQIFAAIFALVTSQLLGNSQMFFSKLIFDFGDRFALLNILKITALFVFMILPAFFLGATFPVVGKIYTQSVNTVGSSIGRVYAINTFGSVLGSFSAGLILIPLIGKEKGLSFVIALQAATSLIAGLVLIYKNRESRMRTMCLAASSLIVIFLCSSFPAWNRLLLSFGKYHRFAEIKIKDDIESSGYLETLLSGPEILAGSETGELVCYGEGMGGFITVIKYTGALGEVEYSMANSGKADASSRGDMKTQTLLAHFPMLFHENPETVMVLGLASGITAGEVLRYPVKRLDVIDINREAVECSNFFSKWNNGVLSDKRTNLIIQDGRAHLNLTGKKYDVIISEPSNPWMAGMAALFTADFFKQARERLNRNGIFVQWVHAYQMDWQTLSLIGRTFARVFPRSVLVSVEPSGQGRDYLLVGFRDNNGLIFENVKRNIIYARESGNIKLSDPKLIYRLIASEDLQKLFGDGPVNTDNRPGLEFAAPRLMFQGEEAMQTIWNNIKTKRQLSGETMKIMDQAALNINSQIDFAEYALSVYSPFKDMVDMSKAGPAQKSRFYKLMYSYCAVNGIDCSIITDNELRKGCRQVQIDTIKKNIGLMPNKALSYSYLADLFYESGSLEEAITGYNNSLKINPKDAAVHNNLGYMKSRLGRYSEAIPHFVAAFTLKPNFITALGNYAEALIQLGRIDEALDTYKRIRRIKPDLAEPYYYIGYILAQKGRINEAVPYFRKALRLQPDWADVLNSLAWILATSEDAGIKNPGEALELAQKACRLTNSNQPGVLYTLAIAYGALCRYSESIQAAESALKLSSSSGQKDLSRVINGYLRRMYDDARYNYNRYRNN